MVKSYAQALRIQKNRVSNGDRHREGSPAVDQARATVRVAAVRVAAVPRPRGHSRRRRDRAPGPRRANPRARVARAAASRGESSVSVTHDIL